jgi:XapX domain-containing protein
MRVYLLSFGAGLLVGVVYSLLNVRSPAPPVVALVGLMGILMGEQILPVAKHMLDGSHLAAAWRQSHGTLHIFGLLPGRHERAAQSKVGSEPAAGMTALAPATDLVPYRGEKPGARDDHHA